MSEDAKDLIQRMKAEAQETANLAQRGFGMEFAFALKVHSAFVQELLQESNPGERLQQFIAAVQWETSPEDQESSDLLSQWGAWSTTQTNWRGDKSFAGFLTTRFSPQRVPEIITMREMFSSYGEMVEWALLKDWEIRQYFRMGPRTYE